MKKLLILTAVLPLIAACTPKPPPSTLVCNREAIAWDKVGEPSEMAEICLPAPLPAPVTAAVVESDDPHDPMLPPTTPKPNPTPTPNPEPNPEPARANASNHANERAWNNNGKGGVERDTTRNIDKGRFGGRSD